MSDYFVNTDPDLGYVSMQQSHGYSVGDIIQLSIYFTSIPYLAKIVNISSDRTFEYRNLAWYETAWHCLKSRQYKWAALSVYAGVATAFESRFPQWVSVW